MSRDSIRFKTTTRLLYITFYNIINYTPGIALLYFNQEIQVEEEATSYRQIHPSKVFLLDTESSDVLFTCGDQRMVNISSLSITPNETILFQIIVLFVDLFKVKIHSYDKVQIKVTLGIDARPSQLISYEFWSLENRKDKMCKPLRC